MPKDTASHSVADDELSEAAKVEGSFESEEEPDTEAEEDVEVEEGAEEDEAEPDKLPDEPDPVTENAERSKLGRRLTKMEKMFEAFMSNFTEYTNKQGAPEAAEEDDYTPLTKREAKALFEKIQTDKTKEQDVYADTYLDALEGLADGEEDQTFFDSVLDLMKTDATYNTRLSSNPKKDAEFNYMKAANAVLRKGKSEKRNPLAKNKAKKVKHIGVNGDTVVTTKTPKTPELDKDARKFAEAMGMSPEKIAAALAEDLPLGMRGIKSLDMKSI